MSLTQNTVSSSETFSLEARQALSDLLVILGDNKHFLCLRFAEWCNSAPTLEAAVAASAMAQDELGHTRNIYPLLKGLGVASEGEDGMARQNHRHIAFLDQPFGAWPDFVVASFFFDQAITVMLESAINSRYLPLRQRTRKMAAEEKFHALYGQGWFRRLAQESGEVRALLEASSRRIWPEVLCFYGPAGNDLRALKDAGLLNAASDELRARFLARVNPTLQTVGFDLRADPLPWERWDAGARRLK